MQYKRYKIYMSETERKEKTKTETDDEGNTTTETEVEEKKEDDQFLGFYFSVLYFLNSN